MAYTYDDFVTAANSSGLMKQFSDSDLQIAQKSPEFGLSMLGILKDGNSATTAEQKLLATEAANQLRKTYGSFGQNTGNSDFQYGNETAYQKLLESVTNPEGFQYNPKEDPMWSAYKKAMLREGERASANALAQASAASGGKVSSYALGAAQQAANYYASQLGDMLPTLQQNAYQKYLNEVEEKINSLGALQSDRETAYQRYLNERQTADAAAAEEQARLEAAAKLMAQGGDFSRYGALYGLTDAEIAQLNALYAAEPGGDTPTLETEAMFQNSTDFKNMGLDEKQIKQMQEYFGVEADGMWGNQSASAAGGRTAQQAWDYYQEQIKEPDEVMGEDMQSILDLGYGPISAARLEELIAAGEVEEYVENGMYKYRRAAKTPQNAFGGLGNLPIKGGWETVSNPFIK